jgi:F-type H+-transporting ATPase subunit b
MDTLGQFHLQLLPFAAQLFNFLVIAWVINRFLLRPLMKNMKVRKEKIAQGLADAEKARVALAEAAQERERVLQQASVDAYKLLQGARQEAERLRAAEMVRAGTDAQRLIEEARGVMALERAEMEKAVQVLSLQLSGRILETALEGLFNDEEKARILSRGLERIGTIGRS